MPRKGGGKGGSGGDITVIDGGLSGRPDRHMSLNQVSKVTGWARTTLERWEAEGMPTLVKKGAGKETLVDLREVLEWWRNREIRNAMSGMPGQVSEAMGGEDEFKPFLGIREPEKAFRAMVQCVNFLDARDRVMSRDRVTGALERAFSIIRQATMGQPDVVARVLIGFPEDRVLAARRKVLEANIAMLKSAAEQIDRELRINPGERDAV